MVHHSILVYVKSTVTRAQSLNIFTRLVGVSCQIIRCRERENVLFELFSRH